MSRVVLFEDDRGYLVMEGNELTIGSKLDDPPKLRVCVPITEHGGGGGVVSFSRARSYGVCFGDQQDEMGYIRMEQAEDVRRDVGNLRSELNVFVASGIAGTDVERVFACTWDSFTKWGPAALASLRAWLSLSLPALPAQARLISPDGNTQVEAQSDGNYVVYQRPSIDQPFVATFDSRSVLARLAALEAR